MRRKKRKQREERRYRLYFALSALLLEIQKNIIEILNSIFRWIALLRIKNHAIYEISSQLSNNKLYDAI